MKNTYLIYAAKVFSMLFAPFYFPMLAFLVLFVFSYMRLLPVDYKLAILGVVYGFTVALPLLFTWGYRKINGLHRRQLSKREMRTMPYLIFIASYGCCLYCMIELHMPHFMISIMWGSLVLQVACALIHRWVHISTHSAAAGAMVGALMAFSFIFSFDPTWWLCLTLLIAGCVGSSRLILRQHRLREVNLGLLVGLLCGFFCILLL
ncbi:MAG: phosphatase PAP2 family protein [Bacteroidaceae bacterium]|nr:phosphatase PAP2 family protein [Bacteroidaceae bacterium]